jgi:signal transduction histidine kinase
MAGEPLFIRRADHGARILVVDDDALARRSLRAMLERSHYQVETAESGDEALQLLPGFRPDLVLLDIQMPVMDGLEVCRQIRDLPNGDLLPIIFLTADERPEVHAQAFRVKGDDFLRKPVLSAELIVRVRSLMRLKRLQAEVQAERDNLLDMQKQQEQLFGFIVHDLKNPLSAIQMGLELLEVGDGDGAAATRAQIQRIRETAQYMGRMVQDILDIGRAEQVGLELRKRRFSLAEWMHSLLKGLTSQAESRSHHLTWACPEGLLVEADPEFLRRLLLNLVDNALKYSPPGSHTQVVASTGEGCLRLEVRDQGDGIPDTMREQIFGKFIRLERKGPDLRSGSGLGLAFCRMVAEAHGGRIWVEDNQPNGSIFALEIPQVPALS